MNRITTSLSCLAAFAGVLAVTHPSAASPCTQPDVLAFVNQSRQSSDMDALGIQRSSIQVRRLPARYPGHGFNLRTTVCSAWMLSRNPAWQPGSEQPHYRRVPQSFWVSKLESGYEVGLIAQR